MDDDGGAGGLASWNEVGAALPQIPNHGGGAHEHPREEEEDEEDENEDIGERLIRYQQRMRAYTEAKFRRFREEIGDKLRDKNRKKEMGGEGEGVGKDGQE
ncbi:hypothetical protein MNV49_005507 [Pseudohyphozyma bogoriensis]|nr:hypothetical protein MNV49_005507 [Pseudohyphozyma bogoriensis]